MYTIPVSKEGARRCSRRIKLCVPITVLGIDEHPCVIQDIDEPCFALSIACLQGFEFAEQCGVGREDNIHLDRHKLER